MRFLYVVPFCFLIYENKGRVAIPILIRISIGTLRLFSSVELQRRFREGEDTELVGDRLLGCDLCGLKYWENTS